MMLSSYSAVGVIMMFIYEYFRGSGKAMYRAQATLTATINGR